jgi:LuxR family maltose regulon positive regulatory protein
MSAELDQLGIEGPGGDLAVTKLAPQARDDGHVARHALLSKIEDLLSHRLTIVHAGAGYGKTSLLMQWMKTLRGKGIATAWLTLEEEEARAVTCLEHIMVALERLDYLTAHSLSDLTRFDDRVPVKSLATALINLLAQNDAPLVIFLDEYNRAQSEETDALFQMLVRQVPPNVHFVIASRYRPNIEIENLRVHGELLEIQTNHLRFSEEEAAGLMERSGVRLSRAQLHRLIDRTEGWPIALQMVRLWLNGDANREGMVSDFSGRTTDLARYMTEQVLTELPEEQQTFLMQTSILERVNGELANAVTGRNDSWLMLERFLEKSLFVIPESDDWTWFRYHTLFLDYLRDRLERHQPQSVPELHLRAARWYGDNGYLRQAIDHALKGGSHDLVARLVKDAGGWRLILDGRIGIIRRAVTALPLDVVSRHAGLALSRSILMVKDGDIRGGRAYLDGLDRRALTGGDQHAENDWDICDHILVDYEDNLLEFSEIERIENLRQKVSMDDHVVQAILSDSLARLYFRFGQQDKSLQACEGAISHYQVMKSLYGEVFSRLAQARVLIAEARLEDAEDMLRRTEADLEARFGEAVELSPHISVYLAMVLAERSEMEEAAARLEEALPIAEQSDGWLEFFADAYTAAAAVAWATGGIEATMKVVARARQVGSARGLERLTLLADCDAVCYLSFAGRTEEAAHYGQSFEEIASRGPKSGLMGRENGSMVPGLVFMWVASGRGRAAVDVLTPLIEEAERHGEIRRLVGLELLAAYALENMQKTKQAEQYLANAVRHGQFTGMIRLYQEVGCLLVPLLERILSGESSLPVDRYRDSFLRDILKDLRRAERQGGDNEFGLTPGEIEVLRELDHGLSNKEIARKIGVSPNTVKYRMKGLFSKLGVTSRSKAVRRSRELSILS